MRAGDIQQHCPAVQVERDKAVFPCSFAIRMLEDSAERQNRIEQRLQGLERRIDRLDDKVGTLEDRLGGRIDNLSNRIDGLHKWTVRMMYALLFGCAGIIVSLWVR